MPLEVAQVLVDRCKEGDVKNVIILHETADGRTGVSSNITSLALIYTELANAMKAVLDAYEESRQ